MTKSYLLPKVSLVNSAVPACAKLILVMQDDSIPTTKYIVQ